MAKILLMNIPGHGHVNPTLPVVQELVARGHQVIYYNTEDFRPQIERAGAEFRAYPASALTAEAIASRAQNLVSVTALLLETSEWAVPWMLEQIRLEKPDVLIHDSNALWGMICGRILNVPTISSITTFVLEGIRIPWSPRLLLYVISGAAPYLLRIANARRRLLKTYGKHSLPTAMFPAVGGLNLVFTSREFQQDTPFVDERFRFVGPSLNAQTRGGDFPFEQLTRRPVVYISLGTIHSHAEDFYRRCFAAFADMPAQFILSAGQQTDITALGTIPANFIVRPSVPQLEVLQQVDLFVTHGGMNSINEALYYGVPMVVIPQQLEQYFNGLQVLAKETGIMLGKPLAFGQVSVKELRTAVQSMLNSLQRYQAAARHIGDTFRQAGGYQRAVAEIEAYLGDS
ncbi:MAG: macrolide family glycosyltransferase [Anaerolineae bacterium]